MRCRAWAAVLLAAHVVACAAAAAVPDPVIPADLDGVLRAHAVGDVFITGQPSPAGLLVARDRGVTTVINIRPAGEMSFAEKQTVEELGMRYVPLPFVPTTLDDRLVEAFIEEMRTRRGQVLLHGSSGNRVSALWAMYEISELGVHPDTAVARARQAGLRSPELVHYIDEFSRRRGAR